MIEQIERLAKLNTWEIHLYSQRVEDVRGLQSASTPEENPQGAILWHKVSKMPGPHLFTYLWWFSANQWQRRRDRLSGKVQPDLVYSPGINCLDADVIVVHIVFHEFYRRIRSELTLGSTSLKNWPRIIHRRLYYKLIMALEQKIYRKAALQLVAVSSLVAEQLKAHFQRNDVKIIPNAVDTVRFTPEARQQRRGESRKRYGYSDEEFVVLLIGNDWKNKGLDTLIRAANQLGNPKLCVLVVGSDDSSFYHSKLVKLGMRERVRFEKPRPEVLDFYAAADLYAGPSLEDAFNLPILEAMACGLPVIASAHAGASETICDGETGFILRDPQDHLELARLIYRVYTEKSLGQVMGEAAFRAVEANSNWDQNAAMTRQVLEETASQRK